MSLVKMTVRQILDLNLWEKVCEYKGWNPWIYNEGRIDEDEFVEFDTEFKKLEEESEEDLFTPIFNLIDKLYKQTKGMDIVQETIEELDNRITGIKELMGEGLHKLQQR